MQSKELVYKLVRVRKDGTLGPLFIDRRRVLPVGVWMSAEDKPTKGFAHRPGWHCTLLPKAPHLKLKDDRVWVAGEALDCVRYERPESQGGTWVLAQTLRITCVMWEYTKGQRWRSQ